MGNTLSDGAGLGELLYEAAKTDRVHDAERLIAAAAPLHWEAALKHGTPLHCAARHGSIRVARLLIQSRADIERSSGYGTPLHCAARIGDVAMARLLLESRATVDSRDAWNLTPLGRAAERSHAAAVHLLLDYGACKRATDVRARVLYNLCCHRGANGRYTVKKPGGFPTPITIAPEWLAKIIKGHSTTHELVVGASHRIANTAACNDRSLSDFDWLFDRLPQTRQLSLTI